MMENSTDGREGTLNAKKIAVLVVAPVILVAGCATMQPGQGVDADFASRWGCDYGAVMARAESLDERLSPGKMWVPQVGWDACDLMAHNGQPDDVDHQQSRYGRSASWWYRVGDYDMRLISLDLEDGEWVVTYVGG